MFSPDAMSCASLETKDRRTVLEMNTHASYISSVPRAASLGLWMGSPSLFRKTKEIGDKQKLQDDIDKFVRWSEKWQMLFNFGKCKCLHKGPGNTGMNYEMGGSILSKTVKEKDLGVSMNANMKVSEQCRIAASKGNQVIGMIRRNITYKEKSLIVPMYEPIVRPHLEYCTQAWSPYLRKDISCVYTRANIVRAKYIPGYFSSDYIRVASTLHYAMTLRTLAALT